MIEILSRCNTLYNAYPDCFDKSINEKKNNDCLTCTKNNFKFMDNDTYNCLKKLFTYTMFYGPIYVSEIYNFLVQSNFLKSYIEEKRNNMKSDLFSGFNSSTPDNLIPISLNVMSLGCGFGPDDIALNKYRNNHLDVNVNFNYYGYDKEPLWNLITQNNALPITYDLLNGINFKNINILFLNKLFSTLKNHRLDRDFLNVFKDALDELPEGAFVIFNDVNHYNEGRDNFEEFALRNNLISVKKYYFDGHPGDYEHIPTSIITMILPTSSVTSKIYANQTVIFLYQKVL